MTPFRKWSLCAGGALLTLVTLLRLSNPAPIRAAGTASLTTSGVAYTQDFNSLATSGTSSTVPTGWDFLETGTNANLLYAAGTGSSTTSMTSTGRMTSRGISGDTRHTISSVIATGQ